MSRSDGKACRTMARDEAMVISADGQGDQVINPLAGFRACEGSHHRGGTDTPTVALSECAINHLPLRLCVSGSWPDSVRACTAGMGPRQRWWWDGREEGRLLDGNVTTAARDHSSSPIRAAHRSHWKNGGPTPWIPWVWGLLDARELPLSPQSLV
jgi:hypothetical protein